MYHHHAGLTNWGHVMQAIQVESSFHDARFELEDCESEVARTVEAFDLPDSDRSLKPFLETIKERSDTFVFALRSTSNKFRNIKESKKVSPVSSRKQLVDLHARVKKAQLRVLAGERRWRSLLLKVKVEQVCVCVCLWALARLGQEYGVVHCQVCR